MMKAFTKMAVKTKLVKMISAVVSKAMIFSFWLSCFLYGLSILSSLKNASIHYKILAFNFKGLVTQVFEDSFELFFCIFSLNSITIKEA